LALFRKSPPDTLCKRLRNKFAQNPPLNIQLMVRLSEESPQKVAAMIDNDSGILELHKQHAGSSLINALAVASPLSVANLLELVESPLLLATMIVGLPEAIC
ncbi:hypothetical protein FS837_001480, partial [Tulasnella sp. UAMH 9824]